MAKAQAHEVIVAREGNGGDDRPVMLPTPRDALPALR
jgi:hypothetical protein